MTAIVGRQTTTKPYGRLESQASSTSMPCSKMANDLCDLEGTDLKASSSEKTVAAPDLRDHVFTLEEGMVVADGKSHYPDLVRIRIPKEQGLSLAMQILRSLENSQYRPDEAYLMELPLFGRLERLKDE
jgi:hypothetical protein